MSKFQGFTEPNTTPTPNQFFDEIMADINNLAELKCVLYVIRRTYGFLKFVDRIAYSQFENGIVTRDGKRLDKGTGLSGPSITSGLVKAIEHGYLNRYVVCPSCQHEVTERATLEYAMKPRKGKESVTVTKNVAPARCPYCQNELRGKEHLYYSLNFLHSNDLDYLKGLHGVYKHWKLGLSKLFNTQEKEVTRKSDQEKVVQEKATNRPPVQPRDYLDLVMETKAAQDKLKHPITYLSEVVAKLLGLRKVPNHKYDELWSNPLGDLLEQVDGDVDKVEVALRAAVLEGLDGGMTMTTPNSLHGLALKALARPVPENGRAAADHASTEERNEDAARCLAERQAAARAAAVDPWWASVLDELRLQMPTAVFDANLRDSHLLGREDGTVRIGVRNEQARDWLAGRLKRVVERMVAADGVECVEFEVVESGGS